MLFVFKGTVPFTMQFFASVVMFNLKNADLFESTYFRIRKVFSNIENHQNTYHFASEAAFQELFFIPKF